MNNFNFKRLIKKYSKIPAYRIFENEGYRDINQGGKWILGSIQEVLIKDGAVVPLSNSDLKLDEGGTYTTEDRKLYCYEEISKGTKIKHKSKIYTVMEDKDYSDFDDSLFICVLKRGGSD